MRHQRQASGQSFACDRRVSTAELPLAVLGRVYPDAAGEQVAEAAQARESDLHAHVGDGIPSGVQQRARTFEAGVDAELVRRDAEDAEEPPDEMRARHPDRACNVPDRQLVIVGIRLAAQQLARAAQPREDVRGQHHRCRITSREFSRRSAGRRSSRPTRR
jgi:hypothetical protein